MNNGMNFGGRFVDSDVYRRYANNPFTMSHELAHKKVIDHFFPNDPAEIFEVAGRPMTANKWMKTGGIEKLKNMGKNKNEFEIYKKIVIAGYVQEIIELGLEDYFEQILETQLKNVKKTVDFYKFYGFQALFDNCYTNDDGKFYWVCDEAGKNFKQIMREWIEAANWCKNFLKAA